MGDASFEDNDRTPRAKPAEPASPISELSPAKSIIPSLIANDYDSGMTMTPEALGQGVYPPVMPGSALAAHHQFLPPPPFNLYRHASSATARLPPVPPYKVMEPGTRFDIAPYTITTADYATEPAYYMKAPVHYSTGPLTHLKARETMPPTKTGSHIAPAGHDPPSQPPPHPEPSHAAGAISNAHNPASAPQPQPHQFNRAFLEHLYLDRTADNLVAQSAVAVSQIYSHSLGVINTAENDIIMARLARDLAVEKERVDQMLSQIRRERIRVIEDWERIARTEPLPLGPSTVPNLEKNVLNAFKRFAADECAHVADMRQQMAVLSVADAPSAAQPQLDGGSVKLEERTTFELSAVSEREAFTGSNGQDHRVSIVEQAKLVEGSTGCEETENKDHHANIAFAEADN